MRWRGVMTAMAALMAMTLCAGSSRAADAPSTGCRLLLIDELPVKFRDNQPLIELSLNGTAGLFLVDTGSVATIITGDAATKLGLHQFEADGVEFEGVGGKRYANYVTVDVKLNKFEIKSLKLFVAGDRIGKDISGILGRDFLGRVDLEFDMAHQTLRLFKPDHCGSQSLAYWTKEPEIVGMRHDDVVDPFEIKILVNGKSVDAILDSGATFSVVTPDVAALAGVTPDKFSKESSYSEGIGKNKVGYRVATFERITIGDEEIKNAKLQVSDLFADDTTVPLGQRTAERDNRTPTMLLGADFLRSHRVLLITSQERAYFTYSGGPVFQSYGDPVKPKTDGATASSLAPNP